MPLSHICYDCGTDLAFIRARREHHYGFMLVTCPSCRRAHVRRVHPLQESWHSLRRLDWALTILVFNTLLAVVFVGGTIGLVGALVELFARVTPAEMLPVRWGFFAFALLVWPLMVGVWLTACFPHLRRRTTWLAYVTIVVISLVAIAGIRFLVMPPWSMLRVEEELGWWLRAASLTYLLTLVSMTGILPGLTIASAVRVTRTSLWQWRRRRRRRERSG